MTYKLDFDKVGAKLEAINKKKEEAKRQQEQRAEDSAVSLMAVITDEIEQASDIESTINSIKMATALIRQSDPVAVIDEIAEINQVDKDSLGLAKALLTGRSTAVQARSKYSAAKSSETTDDEDAK